MEWRGRRGSNNIEDRRSTRGVKAGGVGGIGVILVLIIGYFLGIDVTPLLNDPGAAQGDASTEMSPADQQAAQFVSVVLADTEEVWAAIFRNQLGRAYAAPTLVLFTDQTNSQCGGASAATGPFYCPGDRKVYLDTAFFATLEQRLGAGGDFAAAYVVAHEVAHAVQDQLGILGQANQARMQASQTDSNAISVMIELQADCFAGVWAHDADRQFGSLENGDINEAVNAARQIGDDTLQANAGQRVSPHTFTHGTSEQRSRWFNTGARTGSIAACDTFSAARL